jgi:hypothetical protein
VLESVGDVAIKMPCISSPAQRAGSALARTGCKGMERSQI